MISRVKCVALDASDKLLHHRGRSVPPLAGLLDNRPWNIQAIT
jgi:hypothetical protein